MYVATCTYIVLRTSDFGSGLHYTVHVLAPVDCLSLVLLML